MDKKNFELDQCVTAYGENYYEKELRFQSKYFPERVTVLEGGREQLSGKKVLDLGVGSGYSVLFFSEVIKDYTVLEGGQAITNKFKEENPNCKANIIQTLFEEFIPQELYDIIIMGCILEHVDDPLEILLHYKKYLKQDGKMYLAVPNWEALHKKIAYHAEMIPDMHFLSDRDYELGHKRTYNIDSFKKLIIDANLKCLNLEGIFLKPIATAQMEKLLFDDKIYDSFLKIGKDYPELSAMIMAQVAK